MDCTPRRSRGPLRVNSPRFYLDAPSLATRAHAFYARRGFRIVDRSELPIGYDFPDRDSVIFKLDMSAQDKRARQGSTQTSDSAP
jgi:hypothetical protein